MKKKMFMAKVLSFVTMLTLAFSLNGVAQAVGNPTLTNSCGLKVVLVLDSSGSMTSADITTVKSSATTLVNALMPSTPAQIGVIDFNTGIQGTSLSPTAVKTDVIAKINTLAVHSSGYTNWDAALHAAGDMVGSGGLVVIITDGNPTTHDGSGTDLGNAITRADAIKTAGSRILAIGINSHGTSYSGLNQANLIAISGPQVKNFSPVPPAIPDTISNINEVDVALGDISALNTVLSGLTTALCGGTINITKVIDGDQAFSQFLPDGFNFTVAEQSVITNEIGSATVHVTTAGPWSAVENPSNDYYDFVSASCTKNGNPLTTTPFTNGVSGIMLTNSDSDVVNCTFHNSPNFGILNVIKHVVNDDQTGSKQASDFTMYADGGTPRSFPGDESGTVVKVNDEVSYVVNEEGSEGYSQAFSDYCSGTMQAGDVKTCTVTNNDNPADESTITFDSDGGSVVDPITQEVGTTVTPPADPTKEGYTFAGWSPSLPTTMPESNMIVVAQWTVNEYTITFDSNGGSEVGPITQNFGTTVTPPADPTKEGYTFGGWDSPVPGTMPAYDQTLTAQWTINSVNGHWTAWTPESSECGTGTFTQTRTCVEASKGGTCDGSANGTEQTRQTAREACSQTTYTVTPSAGSHGTISPNTVQTVNSGNTTTFTVTPSTGYKASVGGTCGGALVKATYTTNAITKNCTVTATFVRKTSGGGGGSIVVGSAPQCSDNKDNDTDGLSDINDPGCHTDSDANNASSYDRLDNSEAGEVLGAATEICNVVDTYMRRGYKNVSDQVQTLQNFLNSYMQSGLVVDGVFGPLTEKAVKAFQLKQRANVMDPWKLTVPTGIFYKTSLAEAKRIMCPTQFGTLPIPTDLVPWSQNSSVPKI